MRVGEGLRLWRLVHGLTLRELAIRIGTSPVTLCDWERGRKSPCPASVVEIQRVTGIAPEVWADERRDEFLRAVELARKAAT